jgi:hypothetical protein
MCHYLPLGGAHHQITAPNGWSLHELYRALETPGASRLRDAPAVRAEEKGA